MRFGEEYQVWKKERGRLSGRITLRKGTHCSFFFNNIKTWEKNIKQERGRERRRVTVRKLEEEAIS